MSISRLALLSFCIVVSLCTFVWFRGGDSDFDEVTFANQFSGIVLESELVDVGGAILHVVFAGPRDGEPVVLLHGFPGFWYVWREHIERLAKAGYRVAAPDLRGYNRSEKPTQRKAYAIESYAGDVIGLLDSQGWRQAHIAGHDIGAHIGWYLVFEEPERVRSAVIYSVPHPLAKIADSESAPNTAYKKLFNLPLLPELISRGGGLSQVAKNMRKTSLSGTFSDQDMVIFKAAWDREHAFSTMIGYYRTPQSVPPSIPTNGRPEIPVMYYFGLDDAVIAPSRARDTASYLGAGQVVLYPELGHWLISEQPEKTANDIISFISRQDTGYDKKL